MSEKNAASVQEQVVQIVREHMSIHREIATDADFVNDLGMDSLDVIELGMEVEDHFKITIPESDMDRLQNVNDIVAYVEPRIKDRLLRSHE